MRIRRTILSLTVFSVCLGSSTAFAQLSITRGQRPGALVNSGVFRAQEFGRPVQITETARPGSIRSDFLVEAVNIIFTQINQAVDAFAALLVLRAGGTPMLPAVFNTTTTPNTNTQPRRKATPAIKSSRQWR